MYLILSTVDCKFLSKMGVVLAWQIIEFSSNVKARGVFFSACVHLEKKEQEFSVCHIQPVCSMVIYNQWSHCRSFIMLLRKWDCTVNLWLVSGSSQPSAVSPTQTRIQTTRPSARPGWDLLMNLFKLCNYVNIIFTVYAVCVHNIQDITIHEKSVYLCIARTYV